MCGGFEGVVGEQLDVRRPATVRSTPGGPLRPLVVLLLLVTTLGAGLWFLTPSNLGGSTTYLVTRGTSMLPTHEPGALVVTRTQNAYAIGDVIAFYREGLDHIVLHRIVGIDGDRFVTRGDNNAFDDTFHPAVSDIVGTQWVHVPRGADVMVRLRSPLTQAVVFGALACCAATAAVQRRRPTG